MSKMYLLLCTGILCFPARGEATACIGYFSNTSFVSIPNQWGNRGDNFSSVNMSGDLSWPTGQVTSFYKSSEKIPGGNWTTYSIALPKRVSANGISFDVSVLGKSPFNTPMNQNYNAWLVNTVSEGCRALSPGWNVVDDTHMSSGSVTILLQGKGLSSGDYNIQIPYLLAWGTDPNQSEVDRIKGTWAEIDPANGMSAFAVSFRVENKCDISENIVNFDYGTLTPDKVNGSKKEKNIKLECLSPVDVSFSLSPAVVDLKNGVVAKIKVKHNENEIRNLNIKKRGSVDVLITSELESADKITEGKFSGNSVLLIDYN